jgi:chloramphenicol 3-O-phosphotransferase
VAHPLRTGEETFDSGGELVIVTGSSHAGKTTLIRELQSHLSRPAAVVAIDEVIESVDLPPEDLWRQGLALAYRAAADRTRELLELGSFVFYESTFTYIPPGEGPPEFHAEQLECLLQLAARLGSRVLVVRLTATLEDVSERQRQTRRLSNEIVRETWHRHAAEPIQAPELLEIDTSPLSPAEIADRVSVRLS